MRLSAKLTIDPMDVEQRIQALMKEARITLAPMDARTATLAVKAFADYGKGRGHQAQLNLADCLSYARAKAQNIPLLYQGKDFSHTDLGQPHPVTAARIMRRPGSCGPQLSICPRVRPGEGA